MSVCVRVCVCVCVCVCRKRRRRRRRRRGWLCLGLGSEWRPMCEQHSIKHTDYQVNTHTDILTELNKRGATEVDTHMYTHTPTHTRRKRCHLISALRQDKLNTLQERLGREESNKQHLDSQNEIKNILLIQEKKHRLSTEHIKVSLLSNSKL